MVEILGELTWRLDGGILASVFRFRRDFLVGLRESLATFGTESCGNSCRDFAGEAPTKLFRLAITPTDTIPLVSCANVGLSVKQD